MCMHTQTYTHLHIYNLPLIVNQIQFTWFLMCSRPTKRCSPKVPCSEIEPGTLLLELMVRSFFILYKKTVESDCEGLYCEGGKKTSRRKITMVLPLYLEGVTHNTHVLCLPLHCLAGLSLYVIHFQLTTSTSLICMSTAALLVGTIGPTSNKTCILPHFLSFSPTQRGSYYYKVEASKSLSSVFL